MIDLARKEYLGLNALMARKLLFGSHLSFGSQLYIGSHWLHGSLPVWFPVDVRLVS